MIIRKREILSFLLCVQLLGNSITYVHAELTAGAPGVCSITKSITRSKSESTAINEKMGDRLTYEQAFVDILQCCTGRFSRVGDECEPVCNPSCKNGGFCVAPFFCQCRKGWIGSTCNIDFNECWTFPCGRSPDVFCNNTPGSYYCGCNNPGFMYGNRDCHDIDECLTRTDNCDQNCTNTYGSFECTCKEGFVLADDNRACNDIDECALDLNDCQQLCSNTNGSYVCRCHEHHVLESDGKSCREITCPDLSAPTNGDIACSANPSTVTSTCDFTCDLGYELQGSSSVVCQPDGTWSTPPPVCVLQQCEELRIPHLGVVQPCNRQYNKSCTFVCGEGYYLDDHGNISTSILCDLNSQGTGVQWSESPPCSERRDACTPPPCHHNGKCTSKGRETYECNCTGTGYTGDSCQFGIINLPEFPPLNKSEEFQFTLEVAKPDNGIDITFEAPADLEIQPRKLPISHKEHQRFHTITLTPKEEGIFALSLRLGGSDRIAFRNPEIRLIVVSDPRVASVSYFDEFKLLPGLLQPGCCQADTKITCSSGKDVAFTSTCSWERDEDTHHTRGIVFSKDSDFSIPLSVGSASIAVGDPTSFDVSARDQSCGTCSSCTVYQPSTSNVIEFYRTEALATTFLNKTAILFPKWFIISPQPTTRSHSSSSHVMKMSNEFESKECRSFPNVKIQDSESPALSVLTYHGASLLTLNNDVITLNGKQAPFCVAVDLCSGSSSPIFISFSEPLDENLLLIKEFTDRGWKISPVGIALSGQSNLIPAGSKIEKEHQLLLKGELELTANLGSVDLLFKFSGEVGLEMEDYSNPFDGLTNKVEGLMEGSLQFHLSVEGNDVYRLTGLENETISLDLGGSAQMEECGQISLQGKLNDHLFTRETSNLTQFLEIPPNLRYGDRYQFDCDMSYDIYTNSTASVSGMVLSSSCHYLRIGRLLFTGPVVREEITGMKQKLYFGKQSMSDCLPETVTMNVIRGFPIVGVAESTNDLHLGHFMELPQTHKINYELNLEESSFSAILKQAKIIMFGGEFTSDITVTSTEGLTFNADVVIFNRYLFNLDITASIDQEWENVRYSVTGRAIEDSGMNIGTILEERTLKRIREIAESATQRLKSAQVALAEVQRVGERLNLEKEAAQNETRALNTRLTAADSEVSRLAQAVERAQQQLSDLGDQVEQIQNRLDDSCMIQTCNNTCAPGLVPGNCTDIILEDVTGICLKTFVEPQLRTVKVSEIDVECGRWSTEPVRQQHCSCAAGFAGCSCSLNVFEGPRYIGTYCTVEQFADVTEQVEVERWVDCVVDRRMVNRIRPCHTNSSCSKLILDRSCVDANDNCTNIRKRILQELQQTQQEATSALEDFQEAQDKLTAATLRRDRLQADVEIAQNTVDQLREDCNTLTTSEQVQNIEFVREVNRVGLKLEELLNSTDQLFKVTNVEFQAIVTDESPSSLVLGIDIGFVNGSSGYIAINFDFDNVEASLSRAEARLAEYVSFTLAGTPGRRKRQLEDELTNTARLQQQNAELNSMLTFFRGLSNRLHELDSAAENIQSSAQTIVMLLTSGIPNEGLHQPPMYSTVNTSTDNNVTRNERSLVSKALDELSQTLASNTLQTASLTTENLFPLWQAQVNILLNETGGLFNQECKGMSDCLGSSLDLLDSIVNSAPRELTNEISSMKNVVERDLEELSTSSELPLMEAAAKMDPVLDVLDRAINSEYWSLKPPNVTRSNELELSVLENQELRLYCKAIFNTRYPVHYQWRKDGVLLPTANMSTFTIEEAAIEDKGNYTCVVSNHAGSTESLGTNVTVLRPPTFYYEPFNKTVTVGDANPAVLICNATSVPNPQFKWYFKARNASSFSRIPGIRGNEYHVEDPQKDDEGWYHCEAWIKYNNTYNISTFSRDAYVSVVDASITGLSIPVQITIQSAEQLSTRNLRKTFRGVTNNTLQNSPFDVRPTISQLRIDMMLEQKQAIISALVNSKNAIVEGIPSKLLPEIAAEVSRSRQELANVAKNVKYDLLDSLNYGEIKRSLHQLSAVDTSDHGYVFKCPRGQQLDENSFLLCSNCPPGYYQTKGQKRMTDEKGLEFTVDQQTCAPCPPGTYQPNEGKTECIPCPSNISYVEGAITDEQCVILIDECMENNGGCEHVCKDTIDSFTCACREGYKLETDLKSCRDINECANNSGGCSDGCVNNEGSYYCDCPIGYELSDDKKNCVDHNECANYNGGCSDGCVNNVGSYYCDCPSGYELSDDVKTCVDADPCSDGTSGCSDGCVNTEGSYYCTCPSGYRLSGDERNCNDIDECTENIDGCSHDCVNRNGTFSCICPIHHRLTTDNRTCIEICDPECQNGGKCTNRTCTCPIGWVGYACEIDSRCQREYFILLYKNWKFLPKEEKAIVAYSEGAGRIILKSGGLTIKKDLLPAIPVIFPIPGEVIYNKTYQLIVQSSAAVDIFGGSFSTPSSGVFKIFPAEGKYLKSGVESYNEVYRYFGVSVPPISIGNIHSAISIVAIANDTNISINLTANATVFQPYSRGDRVIVHAKKGQPIPILSEKGDLTGTEIVANKPLAVYSGHECATVPNRKRFCDQIVEQIPPVSALGKKYIVSPFAGRLGGAIVKILGTYSPTTVKVTCNESTTTLSLQSAQFHQFATPADKACYISSTRPILVTQMSTGGGTEEQGDPSMVVVPPIERFSTRSVIYSFPNDNAVRHYISVIAPYKSLKRNSITIDGNPINKTDIVHLPGTGQSFFVARITVTGGIHKLLSKRERFGVVAYGFGPSTGYAYSDYVQALPCRV